MSESSRCSSIMDLGSKPYQPDPKFIQVQQLPNKVLRFQTKWYSQYTWLHYSITLKKVLCFECVKAYAIKKTTLEKKMTLSFVSKVSITGRMLQFALVAIKQAKHAIMQSQSMPRSKLPFTHKYQVYWLNSRKKHSTVWVK